jgi:hypothetical protein
MAVSIALHDGVTLGVPKAAATRSAPKIRNVRLKAITSPVLKREAWFQRGTCQCRCPPALILAIATALPSVPTAVALAHFSTLVLELACATQTTAVAIALRLLDEPGLWLGCCS